MARLPSVSVLVINIAITTKKLQSPDHYLDLLQQMRSLRAPVQPVAMTRSDAELYFGWLNAELEQNGAYARGYIDRAIDVQNRDWYSDINRAPATFEELDQIKIPAGLKAKHREFTFLFDLNRHLMFIDNRDGQSVLNPYQAEKLFETLADDASVRESFGPITVNVVKDRLALAKLLKSRLKSLTITIQPDNGDMIDSKLRDVVLEQMDDARAEEAEISFRSKGANRLNVNDSVRDLAEYAASGGGDVSAKVEEDGHLRNRNLTQHPLEATESYDPRNEERFAGMLRAIRSVLMRMKK